MAGISSAPSCLFFHLGRAGQRFLNMRIEQSPVWSGADIHTGLNSFACGIAHRLAIAQSDGQHFGVVENALRMLDFLRQDVEVLRSQPVGQSEIKQISEQRLLFVPLGVVIVVFPENAGIGSAVVVAVVILVVAFFAARRFAAPLNDLVEFTPVEPYAPALGAVVNFDALPLGED